MRTRRPPPLDRIDGSTGAALHFTMVPKNSMSAIRLCYLRTSVKIPRLTSGRPRFDGQRDRRSQVKLSYGVLGLGNEDFSSGRGALGVARGERENVV
jgi:hypothetical protein